MVMNEERVYTLALTLVPGIGPRTARKILNHTGSARAFFSDAPKMKFPGIKKEAISGGTIRSYVERAEREFLFAEKENIRILIHTDRDYPQRLKACEDSPLLLFSRGTMELNAPRMIAIVGTRKATEYGRKITEEIIRDLSSFNVTLVSGLAYGIDSIAHKSALNYGIQNLGVVAHGLDRIYPSLNAGLAKKMMANGGLLSDFISETKPDRENFPSRNRIIAGLSDAVIVIEAAEKGGALITADIAGSYHREVFAVPGKIGDEFSSGCNNLIRDNKAQIISTPHDIPWFMGWSDETNKNKAVQPGLFKDLIPEEEAIILCLRRSPLTDIDTMAVECKLPVNRVSALLLGLEFNGVIESVPGKRYRIV